MRQITTKGFKKNAMPVPQAPDELKSRMPGAGLHRVDFDPKERGQIGPDLQDTHRQSKTPKTEIRKIIGRDINLPLWGILEQNSDTRKIIDIGDGNSYYFVSHANPKYGKPRKDGSKKDYPGYVALMNIDNGTIDVFTYERGEETEITKAVKAADEKYLRPGILEKMNQGIDQLNERMIEWSEDNLNITNLPLIIGRAKKSIDSRLAELSGQQGAFERLHEGEGLHEDFDSVVQDFDNFLREIVTTGTRPDTGESVPKEDIFDSIIYLYYQNPESLESDITSGTLQIAPEVQAELQPQLIEVANLIRSKWDQSRSGVEYDRNYRQQREDSPEEFDQPDVTMPTTPIESVTLGDILGIRRPAKTELFSHPGSYEQQGHEVSTELGIDQDTLQKTRDAIDGLHQAIVGRSESGQTLSLDSIRKDPGFVASLTEFKNSAKTIVARYLANIIKQDGTFDRRMFGKGGAANLIVIGDMQRAYMALDNVLPQLRAQPTDPAVAPTMQIPSPGVKTEDEGGGAGVGAVV